MVPVTRYFASFRYRRTPLFISCFNVLLACSVRTFLKIVRINQGCLAYHEPIADGYSTKIDFNTKLASLNEVICSSTYGNISLKFEGNEIQALHWPNNFQTEI